MELFVRILKASPCDHSTLRVILNLTDGGGKMARRNSDAFSATQALLHDESPDLVRQSTKRKFSTLGGSAGAPGADEESSADATLRSETLAILYSRIQWHLAIPSGCLLFAQGAGGVLKQAAAMGKHKGCTVVVGPIYDSSGAPTRNTTSFLSRAKRGAVALLDALHCCPHVGSARVVPS